MASSSNNSLWNPSRGIRFSPKPSPMLYPSLGTARSLHAPSSNAGSGSSALKEDEFSDDEQFERDAAEWFDQQDELAKVTSEVKADQTNDQRAEPGETSTDSSKAKKEKPEPILPPETSLDFNISHEQFYAALKSRPESPGSFWSYKMYHRLQPDGTPENVKVHYCTSKNTMEWVCKRYFLNEPVLGFDLEWMAYAGRGTGPRQNVSLIQIASPSRIGLFHVAVFAKDDFVAPSFRQIMQDEGVSKVGVNIQGDCTRLKKFLGVDTKGIFELSHLYKLVKYSKAGELNLINRIKVALSVQVQEVLGLPLYKGAVVRSGNWMKPLNENQLSYSASDAYAGLQLYHVLEGRREKLDPCPPRPHFAEKGLPIRVATTPDPDEEDVTPPEDVTELEPLGPELSIVSKKAEAPAPCPPAKQPSKPPLPPKDTRIIAAETRLKTYRSNKAKPLAAQPAAVRAYYIWHDNDGLEPEAMAKLLREPPLKTTTVVGYILNAITLENLPYDTKRLKEEVLSHLVPGTVQNGKFKALVEEVHKARDLQPSEA